MGRARAGGGTRRVVVALVVLSTFGLVLGAGAVPGSPDPGYGSGGVASVPADPGRVAFPTQMVSTPSGAVWAILWEQVSGGGGSTDLSRLIRFAPDGSVVGSLDLSAYVPPPPPGPFGTSPRLSSLAADGEDVYVTVTTAGVTSESSLLRIRADLTPDPSFGGDGEIASESNELGVPLDPSCIGYCGLFWPMLAAGPDGSVYSVLLWSDPAIGTIPRLVKVRSNGTLDPSFGTGGAALVDLSMRGVWSGQFGSLSVDGQGRILVVSGGGIQRLLPSGAVDASFGSGEIAGIARFVRPDGTEPDDSFSCNGLLGTSCPTTVLSDGSVVTGASRYAPDSVQTYSLLVTSPSGSVTERVLCTADYSGGTPSVQPGCGPVSALFATSGGGSDQLHFVSGNQLRTLPAPLPAGDLLAQSIASSTGVLAITAAPGQGRTAFAGGAVPSANGAGQLEFRGGVSRILLDVPPTGPTGTVSPPSGPISSNASVQITYSCSQQPCAALLVSGPVPDPIPAGWSPSGTWSQIPSGATLDTSVAGEQTVLVATFSGTETIYLARATYVIGAPPPDGTPPLIQVTENGAPLKDEYVRSTTLTPESTCDDGPTGSGVASCGSDFYVVPGHVSTLPPGSTPLWQSAWLDTVGPFTFFARATDVAGNETWFVHQFEVLDGVEGNVSPGGTLVLGYDGGPQVADLYLTLPAGGQARMVRSGVPSSPAGFELLGNRFDLSMAPQTAADPAVLTFFVPTGLLNGVPITDLKAFKDGVVVPDCTPGSSPAATPDPCVQERTDVGSGAFVAVRSSTGSVWTIGRSLAPPSAPGAPTEVQAIGGPKKADVTWTAPSSTGGSPITSSYILATPAPGAVDPATGNPVTNKSKTVTGDATAATIALASGVSYDITVRTRNGVVNAWSPYSSPAVRVTTPSVPGVPTDVVAVPGAKKATVTWTAPSSDEPITGYVVTATATAGGAAISKTVSTPVTTFDVTGLANSTEYTFRVKARSAAGDSALSAASAAVTTLGLQGPPTDVSVLPGARSATLSWTPPASDAAITGYTVVATPAGGGAAITKSAAATATSYKFTGLADATSYSFTIAAKSAAGTSAPSASVTTTTFALQGAPTDVTVVPGVRKATVSWTPPPSESPITGYTIVATPTAGGAVITKSAGATATSYSFTGLANSTEYSFTIATKSAVGTSPVSDPAIVIQTPALPVAPVDVTTAAGASSAVVSWNDAAVDPAYPVTRYSVTLAATRPDSSVHTRTVTVNGVLGLPAATSTTVPALEAGLTYSVSVTATNAVGIGPASAGPEVSPFLGLSVADVTKVEGTASTTQSVSLSVKLSAKSTTDVSFTVATADGTAVAPGDYTALAPTVFTIPAGSTSKTVTVKTVRDSVDEPDEAFQVVLSDPFGATITRGSATVTLTDDD